MGDPTTAEADWNPNRRPMPTEPVWHFHVPTLCTCTDGLTLDENWSAYSGPRADPPWPGEGWLVCGICDGDGWYWKREEAPNTDFFALVATIGDLCNVWSIGNDGDVVRLADAIRSAIRNAAPKEGADRG